jgi:tetratricopeptide (TPR) repeat protein
VEKIGSYQLQKAVGRGGTGVVFEALDPSGRRVAVKAFTHGAGENAVLRERLLADARLLHTLSHPNLAAILDAGTHQGRPYVVTEFVEGVCLARALRSDLPLPIEWTLDVLRQIALGLACAHGTGLFHLDLKPTDVRITSEGDVKVLDFGVTHLKPIEPGSPAAVHGINYRAPEQIEGRRADERADVFAVGAIAYELACRRAAFPGEDPTAVMLRITKGAPDFEALPKTPFSPRFEAVVAKALARDPAARYGSLLEMHDDLVGLVREVAPRLLGQTAEVSQDLPLEIGLDADPAASEALRAEMEEAMVGGRLPKALDLCRRLLAMNPGDAAAREQAAAIEAAVHHQEVEQLCGMALGYAADGDLPLARKIADRILKLAPGDPRYERLDAYLTEESGRRAAVALLASARDQLALGNLEEARALAEDAILADPGSTVAREIMSRLSPFLGKPEPEGGL